MDTVLKHKNNKGSRWLLQSFFLFILAILLPYGVTASSYEVNNNVSVSANTGGNSGGSVQSGQSSVSVEVHQTVNGVEQPPIVVATTSNSGQSVGVVVHSIVTESSSLKEVEIERGTVSSSEKAVKNLVTNSIKKVVESSTIRLGTTTTVKRSSSSSVSLGGSKSSIVLPSFLRKVINIFRNNVFWRF